MDLVALFLRKYDHRKLRHLNENSKKQYMADRNAKEFEKQLSSELPEGHPLRKMQGR